MAEYTTNEIKKALLKQKPIANRTINNDRLARNGINLTAYTAYVDLGNSSVSTLITFEIPDVEMTEIFKDEMPAQSLNRWIVN